MPFSIIFFFHLDQHFSVIVTVHGFTASERYYTIEESLSNGVYELTCVAAPGSFMYLFMGTGIWVWILVGMSGRAAFMGSCNVFTEKTSGA